MRLKSMNGWCNFMAFTCYNDKLKIKLHLKLELLVVLGWLAWDIVINIIRWFDFLWRMWRSCPYSPMLQSMKLKGCWGTEPCSKTKASQCADRWVLVWLSDSGSLRSDIAGDARVPCFTLSSSVGAELKIDHRFLCYAPFWYYPRNNQGSGDMVSVVVQSGWDQYSIQMHV